MYIKYTLVSLCQSLSLTNRGGNCCGASLFGSAAGWQAENTDPLITKTCVVFKMVEVAHTAAFSYTQHVKLLWNMRNNHLSSIAVCMAKIL